MTQDHISAAGLACVAMGIPAAFVAWAFFASRKGPYKGPDLPSVAPASSKRRLRQLAWTVYLAGVGLAGAWVAFSILTADASSRDSARALILALLACGLAAAAPVRPLLGPCAYLVVSYAMPRDDFVTTLLFDCHTDSLLAALSAAALIPWSCHGDRRLAPPRSAAVWALLLYSFWVGVVVIAAMLYGHPIGEPLIHRTGRIVQSLVLCLVAYYSQPRVGEIQLLIVAFAAMLGIRAGRYTDGVRLEQNLAALVAITTPLSIALTLSLRRWWARTASLPITIGLVALVVFIANRGAFLGLAGGLLAVGATARWKFRIAAAAAPAFVLLALLLPQTELGQRLDHAYQEGGFQESAAARIELWTLGLDLARQFPVFGVGPENYSQYFNDYFGVNWDTGAHNIFIDVVAETGYPGLVMFVAIWCCATAALVCSASRMSDRRVRSFALGSLASIWVYLIAGSFLSLASLAFMYFLLGLSLAMATSSEVIVAASLSPQSPVADRTRGDSLTRRDLDLAALLYTCLVVLGSLSPFKFEPLGLTAASERFLALQWWPIGHSSRVDVVSNVVLFIPLGFLVMGSLTCDALSRAKRWAAVPAPLLACLGIGAAVEYLQCWFPSRTVSAQDVMSQLVGAAVGAGIWMGVGQGVVDRWRRWRLDRADLSTAQKAILVYAGVLLVWGGWPLDVTMHPVELWHKYKAGYISAFVLSDYLMPLAGGASSAIARLLLPMPFGWFISGAWLKAPAAWRPWRQAVAWALAAALGIEALRLIAQGHMATGDQCLVSFAGVLLGCILHRRLRKPPPAG